jgi:LmbE family N-acetylglucosaminyl deacetylase
MEVLAFFAHPDDETILAGGTLALLAGVGVLVHYLCATRGEGGELGDPPVCRASELGRVREAELACAVEALGGADLTFLDYEDPRVGPGEELFAYTDDLAELSGELARELRLRRPAAVLTHGSNGEYGHPAHVVTHSAARRAVESLGASAPLLYTVSPSFEAHPVAELANKDDPADLVLDVGPAIDHKIKAALCHRTQHALFVRRASERASRRLTVEEMIARYRLEGLHRAAADPPREAGDPLTTLLSPYSITY